MDAQTPYNPKRTRQTQQPCHVSDKCDDDERLYVPEFVCRDLETTKHTDDKHYCLLHLPTKEKDIEKFEQIFQARLHEHDEAIAKIEADFPDDKDKQQEAKRKQNIDYDFRYVYFPARINVNQHHFKADTDFRSATFLAVADFRSATFSAVADFRLTIFLADADFKSATFLAYADFSEATFSVDTSFNLATFLAHADFRSTTFTTFANFHSATFLVDVNFSLATFLAHADFRSATFSAVADFSLALFSASADFRSAKFLETSQTYFESTKFCSTLSFYQTEFDGYVEFIGNVFLNADDVQNVRKGLNNKNIKDEQEAFLRLEKARLNKPERISFNSILLRPSWFVGTDVRNLNFNDVEWLNLEIDVDRSGLDKEFDNLTKHNISQPKESLIKAMNQLGDNAEANRRFEEAKLFRKQSIALKNYKCHVADGLNKNEKDFVKKYVCQDYPVVNEDGGQYYCLWHNPDKNKAEVLIKEFEKCRSQGHQYYNYSVFPIEVTFVGDLPIKLYLSGARFQKRLFFFQAKIHKLFLGETHFEKDAELVFEFSECDGEINLDKTVFDGRLNLYGSIGYKFFKEKGSLSMREARFDKPNWINFRNVRLLSEYFFDVDASRFTFYDCKWNETDENKLALNKAQSYQIHKQNAQTCTHLALNYEENRHFEESSIFRYASMESKRYAFLSSEKKGLANYFNRLLYWLYKWTSGYGESWSWAMGLLLSLLIGFGVLFSLPISKFDYGKDGKSQSANNIEQTVCDKMRLIENSDMNVCEGIIHSLSVATFQRPEPKPADNLTKLFIVLEVIFAPLQAALLALAIRRKFMR